MSSGNICVQPNRLPDQIRSFLRVLSFQGNGSELMQRLKMIWLLSQNFPIDALRVRMFPLLMQRCSLIELGLQCHRS